MVLAIVGLYALMAHAVTERTRENGILRALGAHRARILRMVMRDGLRPVVVGLVLGVGVAILATRPFAAVFAGITTEDRLGERPLAGCSLWWVHWPASVPRSVR